VRKAMTFREWFLPANQLALVHKLWTVRISFVGAILSGLYAALPAFQAYVSPAQFAMLCVGFLVAIVFARVVNQTGIDF
jgi:hypothetical protein